MKNIAYLLFCSFIILGCRKSEDSPYFGYEYFGLDKGRYVTYDVMEIFHDENLVPSHDTVRYTLKILVGEKIEDNEGRKPNKIFRHSYDPDTDELIDQRVWTAIIDEGRGEVVEENQRKIRMVFAVALNKEWDVNVYNPEDAEEVYYEDIHQPYSVGGYSLDSTVRVEYEDFISLVDYRRKYEVYGKEVGLVHRSFKDLTIENFDTTAIRFGTETHYVLKDFGIE